MKDKKIVQCLTWVEPTSPPRIIRNVIFSLMNYEGDLYFVNDSQETLAEVSTTGYGFVEDSMIENNVGYSYKNVEPKQSVRIESYDCFYDCDFVLGLYIYLHYKDGRKMRIDPRNFHKGGVRPQALIYDDLTTPRYVNIS